MLGIKIVIDKGNELGYSYGFFAGSNYGKVDCLPDGNSLAK